MTSEAEAETPAATQFTHGVTKWASSALLAPLYAPGLAAGIIDRLTASPRLGARHASYVSARLGQVDTSLLDPREVSVIYGTVQDLDRLAILAGSLWHGDRVRRLVLSADVSAFVTEFGAEARQVCIEQRYIPSQGRERSRPLADAIRRDGDALRAAWITQIPPPIRDRLVLRLGGALSGFEVGHAQEARTIIQTAASYALPA